MDIPDTEHSTLARIAAMLVRTLEGYGCDGTALLIRAGLDPELLTDPDARYPETNMQQFWRLAVDTTGDECFGLRVAATLHPSALHGLGFSWMASHTLHDAFERVIRYARIVSTSIDVQVEEADDSIGEIGYLLGFSEPTNFARAFNLS